MTRSTRSSTECSLTFIEPEVSTAPSPEASPKSLKRNVSRRQSVRDFFSQTVLERSKSQRYLHANDVKKDPLNKAIAKNNLPKLASILLEKNPTVVNSARTLLDNKDLETNTILTMLYAGVLSTKDEQDGSPIKEAIEQKNLNKLCALLQYGVISNTKLGKRYIRRSEANLEIKRHLDAFNLMHKLGSISDIALFVYENQGVKKINYQGIKIKGKDEINSVFNIITKQTSCYAGLIFLMSLDTSIVRKEHTTATDVIRYFIDGYPELHQGEDIKSLNDIINILNVETSSKTSKIKFSDIFEERLNEFLSTDKAFENYLGDIESLANAKSISK